MTKELKQEYTLRISEANSTELVVILYEMLEIYIEEAKNALNTKDVEVFHEAIRKCTGCVRELTASIVKGSELEGNLTSLYIFCIRELAKAELHYSASELEIVEGIIKKLHSAFKVVADNDNSPAIMGNTQRVYAGLTYGKESLIVHLNQDSNRGYTI